MTNIIRSLHNLPKNPTPCVATIGNFDGVHLGHQAVLKALKIKADNLGLPVVIVMFEPQPNEFFAPDEAPPRLNLFRQKVAALQHYAIDTLCVLAFNKKLANMSAEHFIEHLLVKGLNIKHLIVGDDFKFGKARQGNLAMLKKAGSMYGFHVVNMHTFSVDNIRVSSTRIRTALRSGNLLLAEKLLGRPYQISGRITHGDKRGRTIGFPTANIHFNKYNPPLSGVYAVKLLGIEDKIIEGVANIGSRPTIGADNKVLEVYLFNFERDIYGLRVQVDFLHKLRDEQQFNDLAALKEQIKKDSQKARDYFDK